MRISVDCIKPNPYRKIANYPISRDKVESLKSSISETEFWDNILARPKPNHTEWVLNDSGDETLGDGFYVHKDCEEDPIFEIAYGHHRLQAIKELGITMVDIPIKELDNAAMIKIMANENMANWTINTSIMVETIQVAKEYLESELKKYTYDEFLAQEFLSQLFNKMDKEHFARLKKEGIGQGILKKFLGSNWSDYYIQSALKIVSDCKKDNIDKDALMLFDKIGDATVASKIMIQKKVKKTDQKNIVEHAVDKLESDKYAAVKTGRVEKGNPRRDTKIKAAVEESIEEEGYKIRKENFDQIFCERNKDGLQNANESLQRCALRISLVNTALIDLLELWDSIEPDIRNDFEKQIVNLYNIITKKGKKEWKQTLLQ